MGKRERDGLECTHRLSDSSHSRAHLCRLAEAALCNRQMFVMVKTE